MVYSPEIVAGSLVRMKGTYWEQSVKNLGGNVFFCIKPVVSQTGEHPDRYLIGVMGSLDSRTSKNGKLIYTYNRAGVNSLVVFSAADIQQARQIE